MTAYQAIVVAIIIVLSTGILKYRAEAVDLREKLRKEKIVSKTAFGALDRARSELQKVKTSVFWRTR